MRFTWLGWRSPGAWKWLITCIFFALTGCDQGAVDTLPVQVIDLEQERQNLLQQDQRFAEVAYTEGVAEAYRRFMAEDAIQLPDGGQAIGGRDAIYDDLLMQTEGAEFSLSWEPLEVEIAASGDLGYTWGIYYYEALDELGAPYVAEGKYVYLWRKNAGRWELILDITNQTEPVYEEFVGDELAEEEFSTEELSEDEFVQPFPE
jgi:ketosteroid isomerase-like protein